MINEALLEVGLKREDLIKGNDFLSKAIRRRLALIYFSKKHNLSDSEKQSLFFTRIVAKEVREWTFP